MHAHNHTGIVVDNQIQRRPAKRDAAHDARNGIHVDDRRINMESLTGSTRVRESPSQWPLMQQIASNSHLAHPTIFVRISLRNVVLQLPWRYAGSFDKLHVHQPAVCIKDFSTCKQGHDPADCRRHRLRRSSSLPVLSSKIVIRRYRQYFSNLLITCGTAQAFAARLPAGFRFEILYLSLPSTAVIVVSGGGRRHAALPEAPQHASNCSLGISIYRDKTVNPLRTSRPLKQRLMLITMERRLWWHLAVSMSIERKQPSDEYPPPILLGFLDAFEAFLRPPVRDVCRGSAPLCNAHWQLRNDVKCMLVFYVERQSSDHLVGFQFERASTMPTFRLPMLDINKVRPPLSVARFQDDINRVSIALLQYISRCNGRRTGRLFQHSNLLFDVSITHYF